MEPFILYSIILLWALQLFVLFALFLLFRQFGEVFLKTGEAISRDGIPLGRKIPDFQGISLRTNLRETLHPFMGKPVIMVFISPECKPCRELLPEWNEIVDRYHGQIRFFVIFQGEQEKAREMLRDQMIKGEVLEDPGQELLQAFQVRVTPFGFALDETGIVRAKGLCGGSKHLERLISFLERQIPQEPVLSLSKE